MPFEVRKQIGARALTDIVILFCKNATHSHRGQDKSDGFLGGSAGTAQRDLAFICADVDVAKATACQDFTEIVEISECKRTGGARVGRRHLYVLPNEKKTKDQPLTPLYKGDYSLSALVASLSFGVSFGGQCRFYPSCSRYAKRALIKHGLIRGSFMTAWRLARCNPFNSGGVDEP